MTAAAPTKASRIKKMFFTIIGTVFVVLAAIGVVLPFLPTTPFLLLAAACYLKGSERMHHWLLTNRVFGSYLCNYREGKGMTARNKAVTLATLWILILAAIIFMTNVLLYRIVMIAVPIGVSIHLLRIPTCKNEKKEKKLVR